MKRGHTITRETGAKIAGDLRKRRFQFDRQRAVPRSPAGSGGGGRKYIARLTTAWSGTIPTVTATAQIYEPEDTSSPLTTDTVKDPLGIFSALGVGDGLWVFEQDGFYYAFQAACHGAAFPGA